ncbi:HD domain-containing protein [Chryseobacterium tongliaoense]|uniref:HD domain-containing protein n=1 Tax=Chryseobacterium tongliaoense TaxID=3240933 RepID=UPI003515B138
MSTNNLIENVSGFVIPFLTENLSANLHFHTIDHTLDVVQAAEEIGIQSRLSEEEMTVLRVAAWFHDCGYAHTYSGHEEESKKIAVNFLNNTGCQQDFIEAVLSCIESTKYPQNPSSLVEKVLCDADFYHFTKPCYPRYEQAIRQEFETFFGLVYTDEEWCIKNCSFLIQHQYYTDYGKQVLSRFKEVNIQLLQPK